MPRASETLETSSRLSARCSTNEADSVDYADIADADSLVPFDESSNVGDRAVIAVALRIGKTRLIGSNVVLGEDPSPLALP